MYLLVKPREYRHNFNSLAKTNIKSGNIMNHFFKSFHTDDTTNSSQTYIVYFYVPKDKVCDTALDYKYLGILYIYVNS